MRSGWKTLHLAQAAVSLLGAAAGLAHATGAEAGTLPAVDTAPCMAAIAANEDDKVLSECGALIDNAKTAKTDRLNALIARAGAFTRKDQVDRAIADYDTALQLDPLRADLFNARGELWWKKGDRPKAVADFGAALRIEPDHPAAKTNYKKLAQELERLGAQMAVAGKPSFNCATAPRLVEKAICANPELADLDREIYAMNAKVVRAAQSQTEARALQRAQDGFIARRNAQFGRPGYDLKKEMKERLQALTGADRF